MLTRLQGVNANTRLQGVNVNTSLHRVNAIDCKELIIMIGLCMYVLIGEGFNMEAGQLFCGGCYGESYGATCGGCGSKIGGDQLWVEALDQQWHSYCFTCTVSKHQYTV